MSKDEILEWAENQSRYYLRRGTEEVDECLKQYYFERSRVYEDFHRKLRNMQESVS